MNLSSLTQYFVLILYRENLLFIAYFVVSLVEINYSNDYSRITNEFISLFTLRNILYSPNFYGLCVFEAKLVLFLFD